MVEQNKIVDHATLDRYTVTKTESSNITNHSFFQSTLLPQCSTHFIHTVNMTMRFRWLWLWMVAGLLWMGCASPEQTFRIQGSYFEHFDGQQWKPIFLKGINLSLAFPGHRPGAFVAKIEDYGRFLKMIGEMNANTVRIYTLQPPAFYKALLAHNEAHPDKPLWLLQGVWLDEVDKDSDDYLTSPITTKVFEQEIERVVDALHGNASIPPRPGWSYGIYRANVSRWTVGILLGREMEPYIVDATDRRHTGKVHSFSGQYYRIKNATPIDVWATQQMEYTARYEQEKYGVQRPVGMSNWATLDPLIHVIEPAWSAEDVVAMDLNTVELTPANKGGMFISYHLYPYYPNFVNLDPAYYPHHDHMGHNPYEGYLLELKKHYKHWPLLAAEFGLPATMASVHTSSSGMNHGMINEFEQAKGVRRLVENVYRAGLAGGCVFVWMDEWFKRTWALDPLQELERIPVWHNMLSPEETFGMIAIDAYLKDHTVTLGDPKTWTSGPLISRSNQDRPPLLANSAYDPMREIQNFHVQHDQAFLYLRIQVKDLDPDKNQKIEWNQVKYFVGIDTYDAHRGESRLSPDLPIKIESRVEFLLEISGDSNNQPQGVMKVTPSYDTFGVWHGVRREEQVYRSMPHDVGLFYPIQWIMEDDLADGRDPKRILQERQIFALGTLHYGHQIENKPGYNVLAHFYATLEDHSISVRIPWSLLHVTDPSRLHVLHDIPSTRNFEHKTTEGFRFVLATTRPDTQGKSVLVDVLPGGPRPAGETTEVPPSALYTWQPWDTPTYRERIRPVYYELQRMFANYPPVLPAPPLPETTP